MAYHPRSSYNYEIGTNEASISLFLLSQWPCVHKVIVIHVQSAIYFTIQNLGGDSTKEGGKIAN